MQGVEDDRDAGLCVNPETVSGCIAAVIVLDDETAQNRLFEAEIPLDEPGDARVPVTVDPPRYGAESLRSYPD